MCRSHSRCVPTALVAALIASLAAAIPAAAAQAQEDVHRSASSETQATLEALIASEDRPEAQRARDRYRHPLETLTFFGIAPDATVVEIWPGGQGGYYRRILEPLIEAGGGRYIPVEGGSRFPDAVAGLPYGEVDMVLVFRAHGFTIYDRPAQAYFDAIFAMLRPGGILGIVDHKGAEGEGRDEAIEKGYVKEEHVREMAAKAGFRFLAESEVNRNPKDTTDHPRGVYSLPPTLAGSLPFTDARERFLEIGESDRFTLKFVKP